MTKRFAVLVGIQLFAAACGCPTATSVFAFDLAPSTTGPARIVSADRRTETMVIDLSSPDGRSVWTVSVPPDVTFSVTPGDAFLIVAETACFGEGCSPAYFRLLNREGGDVLIEGGETKRLDGGAPTGGGDIDGVVAIDDESACRTRFVGDDGSFSLDVDETRAFSLHGAPFVAVAQGGLDRTGFALPCGADCAPTGFHNARSAFGYALRIAP